MDVAIKKAQAQDAADVYAITQDAFTRYAQALGLPNQVTALSETVEDVLREIANKNVLIAHADGEAIGAIRFEVLQGGIAYLSRFGVKSTSQQGGVGKQLMHEVEVLCKQMGVKAIVLHTSSKMFPLMRFYYGLDYFVHSTGTQKGYIRALLVHELVADGTDYGQMYLDSGVDY